MDRWCEREGVERGAVMSLRQAWSLSRQWYGTRLKPDFRRPTTAEAMKIFASAGLTGQFWRL